MSTQYVLDVLLFLVLPVKSDLFQELQHVHALTLAARSHALLVDITGAEAAAKKWRGLINIH